MKHFVTLPYLLSMYLTSSGRGFLPLVSWDQAVTPVYIVLTAAYSIQGKEEECMIQCPVADPGFSPGWAPTPKNAIIFQFFVENCMKMKEFGPGGGRASLAPPLDPPMYTSVHVSDMNSKIGVQCGDTEAYLISFIRKYPFRIFCAKINILHYVL